jgi:hypothetical protein
MAIAAWYMATASGYASHPSISANEVQDPRYVMSLMMAWLRYAVEMRPSSSHRFCLSVSRWSMTL